MPRKWYNEAVRQRKDMMRNVTGGLLLGVLLVVVPLVAVYKEQFDSVQSAWDRIIKKK